MTFEISRVFSSNDPSRILEVVNSNTTIITNLEYIRTTGETMVFVFSSEPSQLELDELDDNIISGWVDPAIDEATIAGTMIFNNNGNTRNRYLRPAGTNKTTDRVPFIVPQNCNASSLTFSNENNSRDVDIEIYKNDALIYTWSIENKRFAWTATGLQALTFVIGDRIGIRFTSPSGSVSPRNPVFTISYTVTQNISGQGGIETL